MTQLTRLTIESIAAGGDGVARDDGMVVFVPRTAPGDEATVEVTAHGRLARGELRVLHRASPRRVEPACPHYADDQCGGCQLQHLAYHAQLEAKQRIVTDAFARLARRPAVLAAMHPSPRPWAYRVKLSLTVRRDAAGTRIGLRHRAHPDRVFHLRECPVTDPVVLAAWHEVQASAQLLPDARTLSGAVRLDEGRLEFTLNGGHSWPQAAAFANACASLHAVFWHPVGGTPRLIARRPSEAPFLASFQQVNPQVAALLHAAAVRHALAFAPRTAVDAYAGGGATAVPLAMAGVRITAIEWDRSAVERLRLQLPEGSSALQARVEDALAGSLPVDVVLLNPPREGVDRRVTAALAAAPPSAVVYVSCDPATLARDVARLEGFTITHLEAFDMFPQTAHVETLCVLQRAAA